MGFYVKILGLKLFLPLEQIATHFSLFFQEPVLFSCSIRDNIAYGAVDPEAVTTEDIYRAAKVSNAFDFIQAFPKGFDTVVGEKGVLLSGEKLELQHGNQPLLHISVSSLLWLDFPSRV